MPVITHIAGYCCYTVTKKVTCLHCTERIVNTEGNVDNLQNELIKKTSRGALLYPATDVVYLVLISYIVINKFVIRMSSKVLLATETMP